MSKPSRSWLVPNNTLIVPGNMGDISTMIASAMKIVDGAKAGQTILPPKA